MLPAGSRLRRRQDFGAVLRRGPGVCRVARRFVVVHVAVDGERPTLAGFVVSRAVGTAVLRNAVKRRLRHLMRDRLSALPPGTHLVVRAQPDAATVGTADLRADLDDALDRALKLLRGRRVAGTPAARVDEDRAVVSP